METENRLIQRFEQFTYSINSIYRSILKIERDEMEKYGFRGSYAIYLAAMARFPDGITSALLCEICERDKAGISRVVSEMESHSLIIRNSNKDNAYRAKLTLTEKGRELADFVQSKAAAAVSQAGHGLSDEDRKTFYSCLDLIDSNLRDICRMGISETNE